MDEPSDSPPDSARQKEIDRRTFIAAAGLTAGAAAIAPHVGLRRLAGVLSRTLPSPINGVDQIVVTPPLDLTYNYFIQVERDTDMAVLDFAFYNFEVGTDPASGNPAFLPTTDTSNVIVRFPPQAIVEGQYFYSDAPPGGPPNPNNPTGLPVDPPPILSAMSGPSQISFSFSQTRGDTIPLPTGGFDDLLDWSNWPLSVPLNAQITDVPPTLYAFPEPPGPFDTFIEFPYAMYLAPTQWRGGFLEGFRLGFATVFENTDPLVNNNTGVTALFRSSIVARPFGLIENYSTPNQGDAPIGLATLWCDDLTVAGVTQWPIYNTSPMPLTYQPDADVTNYDQIFYGSRVS
jgi:hypothetical protein